MIRRLRRTYWLLRHMETVEENMRIAYEVHLMTTRDLLRNGDEEDRLIGLKMFDDANKLSEFLHI